MWNSIYQFVTYIYRLFDCKFPIKGTWDQNFTLDFMTYLASFGNFYCVLISFRWSHVVTKFWIWCKWCYTYESTKQFTPSFLCMFCINLWKMNLFWWTYKVIKFWTITLSLDVSDVIHLKDYTKLIC